MSRLWGDIDQRTRDNRRLSTDEITSEVIIIRWEGGVQTKTKGFILSGTEILWTVETNSSKGRAVM